jgi:CubicO group peptidase (beta-lactamase class C family)
MRPPQETLPRVCALLEKEREDGLQIGAQGYVSLRGEPIADFAMGDARPGVPMTVDTLMPWFSCSKPAGAVAFGQLWEQGGLSPDDRVSEVIPEFGARGKEAVTLRHLLTHTAGFRRSEIAWPEASWDEIIAWVCDLPLEKDWIPGQKAGYHSLTSWYILGEVVRRVDGRPYERYVREEIFEPLGMLNSWIAMPPDVYRAFADERGVMQNTQGAEPRPVKAETTEAAWTRCNPGAGAHGPIRELGRFYEALLFHGERQGNRILSPQTVEALTARQRAAMLDHTFQYVIDWGLGFILNSDFYTEGPIPYGFGPYASRRTFGHGGSQSSVSFADPERGLAAAFVYNGMPGEPKHNRRNRAVNAALYEDLGLSGSLGE